MKKNCPCCGKLVRVLTLNGKGKYPEYYYEERAKTPMEKKFEKKLEIRLGIPVGHLERHQCPTNKNKRRSKIK